MSKRKFSKPVWKIDAQNVMRCRVAVPRCQRSSVSKDARKIPDDVVENIAKCRPSLSTGYNYSSRGQSESHKTRDECNNKEDDGDEDAKDLDNDNGGGGDVGGGGEGGAVGESENESVVGLEQILDEEEGKVDEQRGDRKDNESQHYEQQRENRILEVSEAKSSHSGKGMAFKWLNRRILYNAGHKIIGITSSVDSSSGDHTASEISSSVFLSSKGSFEFDQEDVVDENSGNKRRAQVHNEKADKVESLSEGSLSPAEGNILPEDDDDDDDGHDGCGRGQVACDENENGMNIDGVGIGAETRYSLNEEGDALATGDKDPELEIFLKDSIVHYKHDRSGSKYESPSPENSANDIDDDDDHITVPQPEDIEASCTNPNCSSPVDNRICACYNVNAYYSFDDHCSPTTKNVVKVNSLQVMLKDCSRTITKHKLRKSGYNNRSHDMNSQRFGKTARHSKMSTMNASKSETNESTQVNYCFRTISGLRSESAEHSPNRTFDGWGNWSRPKNRKCFLFNKTLHMTKECIKHVSRLYDYPAYDESKLDVSVPKRVEFTRRVEGNVSSDGKEKPGMSCRWWSSQKSKKSFWTTNSKSKLITTPCQYLSANTKEFESPLQLKHKTVCPTTRLYPAPTCYRQFVLHKKGQNATASTHNLAGKQEAAAIIMTGQTLAEIKDSKSQHQQQGPTDRTLLSAKSSNHTHFRHEIQCLHSNDPYVYKNKNYTIRGVLPPKRILATSRRSKTVKTTIHEQDFIFSNASGTAPWNRTPHRTLSRRPPQTLNRTAKTNGSHALSPDTKRMVPS